MPGTVLVVEDDEIIRQVVSEYLKDAGFTALTAGNGAEARGLILRGAPGKTIDLFILDIMLPEISGLELLQIIRASEEYRDAPVIMLTALSDEHTQLKSFDSLANDYVTKPFSPKVLVKRAQALLRNKSGAEGSLQIGAVRVEIDGYEAFEDGEPLPLTLKELELLKVLMINRRRALSRQQLLNLVWGYDYFGDERVVDAHIKNLRKKISSGLITTVKGVGYKIDAPREEADGLESENTRE